MAVPYHELPGLGTLYLEDSFVLAIDEEPGKFRISLECVLTEQDPHYRPPLPNEQHCYERLTIEFDKVHSVDWLKKAFKWTPDADGPDLGSIDTFERLADGTYTLAGYGWGLVHIKADELKVIRQ